MSQLSTDNPLQALVRRCQGITDEKKRKLVWDELAECAWPVIMGMTIGALRKSWSVSGSWHATEDIAMNTFLVLFRQIDNVDPDRIYGYLSTVIYRQLIHGWRKTKREQLTDLLPEHGYNDLNSGSSIVTQLRFEIAKLPRDQRRVIHVRYWLDLDADACARVLQVSKGTVWNWLRKAHANIKQGLLDAGFCGIEDEAGT